MTPICIQRELIVTLESTTESIQLAKYLNDKDVVKYSAYCFPYCLLFSYSLEII